MPPAKYYSERIDLLQQKLQKFLQKKRLFGWMRFAVVIAVAVCVFFLFASGWMYVTLAVIIFLIVFIRLVFADLHNKNTIENTAQLININEDELKALAHNYYHFSDGLQYLPKEHLYAADLDIFGRASLFQFTNRANSEMGCKAFAHYLLQPADINVLQQRQIAIKELSAATEWRQQLQAYGKQKQIQAATQNKLQQWLKEHFKFASKKYWNWLRYILPTIILSIIALNVAGIIPYQIRNITLLIYAALAYFIAKKTAPVYHHLSKIVTELEVLGNSVALLEKLSCKSPLLVQMQSNFLQQNYTASIALKKLKAILERLDLKSNPVVYIPLAVILQWDLQQVLALNKWKENNEQYALTWFDTLAQFEALSSFATMAFNNPQWCFPSFKKEHFFLEGSTIGHPLINEFKRINNDIQIDSSSKIMLVTGSNMAGKSTYLRSIGINVILAMAGAPVCAANFCLSPVQIISSMRIADNLEESTSTFYAELKKLKTIIEKVNEGEKVFILLDEILRGTNSLDRHTGSVALLKQLIKKHAAAIVATHDVELAQLEETYPDNILNYHFDAQVSNEELYFDYKLKEGVCQSLNASILMKKIGIEL